MLSRLFAALVLALALVACGTAPVAPDPDPDPDPDPALQSIAATADAAGTFTVLLAALDEAGLTDTFADDEAGPFTVFAPTDDAFADLLELLDATPEELLERDDLLDILQYHVVNGTVLAADVLALIDTGGGSADIETLGGALLTATFDGTNVILNDDITVDPVDIAATNGVIHVINGVLLPPEADPDPDELVFVDAESYEPYTAAARVDTPFSIAFPAFTGGQAPFAFTLVAGDLPSGFVTAEYVNGGGETIPSETYTVSLDEATGEIAGATGFPGVFTGTVQVSDAIGQTLTADFALALELELAYTGAADIDVLRGTSGVVVEAERVRVGGLPLAALPATGMELTFTLDLDEDASSGSPRTPSQTDFEIAEDGAISKDWAPGGGGPVNEAAVWVYDVTAEHDDSGAASEPVRFTFTLITP